MKLLSLHIDKYKNLTGDYDFTTQDGYIALIGENGSGKSNLLEAISLIFGKLYRISNIEDIRKFRIRYEIDGTEYSYGNIDEDGNDIELEANPKLPSSIISCYSGEDMRLWHMVYENYYMQYFKKALRDKTFSPKLMYINKYCWKIAFIALLCSDNDEVQNFLKDCCHYNDITDVSIKFAVDPTKRAMFVDHLACRWYDTISQNVDENGEINANIFASTDMTTYGATNQYAPNYVFQFLYLLSLPKKDTAKKQTVDKLINDITINVNGVNFDGLSEGEKKMILIECITQILGDENSLVLLDEPDAHTHIARKKDLLEAIELFEGQTILTTHSPVFTALINKNNIFPITKGKFINAEQRDLIIKLANNSINYIDGACIISSKYLALTEGPGDINYITSAINACSKDNAKYKVLNKMSFVYIGGANQVQAFDDDILSKMYDTLESIIFIFDYDTDGRTGAKQVQELIDSGRNKIKILYYNRTYPINPNQDFYLEDMFDRRVYNVVQLPIINGEPTYAQLKKGATLAKSVKDKIAKLYDDDSLNENDYYSFKPFLDELIKLSNL